MEGNSDGCIPKRNVLPRGSVVSPNEQRKIFGTRILVDESVIYDYNAWDEPTWTVEDEWKARLAVRYQSENPVSEDKKVEYKRCPEKFWDKFYEKHEDKFFKDRNWIPIECSELFYNALEHPIIKPLRILEVGCGVGNTIIPLLSYIGPESAGLFIQGIDYSQKAIDIAKKHEKYDPKLWDVAALDMTSENIDTKLSLRAGQLFDVCFCIFVLSAVEPSSHEKIVNNIYKFLKPGGMLLIRDYGKYDMAQLRFKKERLIDDNFYVRGDGTKVYFFSKEELPSLFPQDKFELLYNNYDRRLLLNRSKMLRMHRIWISAKFRKKPT